MKKKQFQFYTQYHQFYFKDKNKDAAESVDPQSFWTETAFKEKLAQVEGGLAIATGSYGNIKGEIEILEKPTESINYNKYDHIVEGGINLQSGELEILDCPNMHLELSLKTKPGKYRVRIYSSNLASVIGDDGNDYYRIEIWPSDDMERKVLKQYNNPL